MGKKSIDVLYTIDLRVYRRCDGGDARSSTTTCDFDRRPNARHIHIFVSLTYAYGLIIK